MKQKAYLYALFVAAFLSLIGILLFLSILGHLEQSIHTYRETELFSRPGAFLYGSFHWFSFYIPLYLFASAFLLLFRPFKSNWLLLLTLSIVPFLTFSLVIKLFTETGAVQAPLSSLVAESFGRVPGAILILVIALIETLLLVQLHGYLNRRSVSHRENMAGGKEKGLEPHGEVSLADASSSLAEITDYLSETDNDWEAKLEEAKRDAEDPPLASEAEEEGSPGGDNGLGTGNDAGNGKDGGNGRDAGTILRVLEDRSLIPMDPPERSGKALETVRAGETIAVEDAEFERVETDLHPVSDKPSRKSYRYSVPVNGILQDYTDAEYWKIDAETQAAGRTLMKTLEEFNISAELTGIQKGPVITMFEILPSPGVKLSRIVNLADNIALRLAALRVRIVAPIPGKHAVGIEVPNKERANVPFKEMITLDKFQKSQYAIPVVLGKDISGVAQIVDLVQTPHLLIAGATGAGKSVCVNAIICSILYKRRPDEVRLMLIDPKIVELKVYNDIPHLLTPVITDPKRSFQALQYCIYEMERRYSLLDALEVRDIHSYNRKITRKALATEPLPYIVIVIDEFADLMATSGKEMESTLARLAAMSRAVGLHLVLATQRPSVDVITGLIKANIPSRIAFMVASKFDSRIIIDTVGADKLLGQGDMLFESAWDPVPIRIQGAYLSQDEIEAITAHVRTLGEPEYIDEEIFFDDEEEAIFQEGEEDPLLDKALEIVITAGKASASYLQRRLKIGYNRAARLVEHMEQRGIVGPANGSKPREILHVPDK